MTKSIGGCEKERPMTRKLLMSAAVVAIALTPSIGVGTAEARDGGFHGGGFHGGGFHGAEFHGKGFHGAEFHGKGFHHRGFVGARRFPGDGFGFGGLIGYGEPNAAAEAPAVATVPAPESAVPAADRPPCREVTSAGVVIERGMSCSRGAQ
jgi:hypothetical protein